MSTINQTRRYARLSGQVRFGYAPEPRPLVLQDLELSQRPATCPYCHEIVCREDCEANPLAAQLVLGEDPRQLR